MRRLFGHQIALGGKRQALEIFDTVHIFPPNSCGAEFFRVESIPSHFLQEETQLLILQLSEPLALQSFQSAIVVVELSHRAARLKFIQVPGATRGGQKAPGTLRKQCSPWNARASGVPSSWPPS